MQIKKASLMQISESVSGIDEIFMSFGRLAKSA
jgi:hypothetical protein